MDWIEEEAVVEAALSVTENISVRVHYVSCNHDILTNRVDLTHNSYLEKFGGLISQTEYDEVLFLFVYTEPLRKPFTLKGYQLLKQH